MQLNEITPGKPYACQFRVTTFVDDNGVPVHANPQIGEAHPGKPGVYEGTGIIQVRDTESQLVRLVDIETQREFVVTWDDCWDVDDVEYVSE